MKRITRLSLALIMFSLFSISYLVTSEAQQRDDNMIGSQAKAGEKCLHIEGEAKRECMARFIACDTCRKDDCTDLCRDGRTSLDASRNLSNQPINDLKKVIAVLKARVKEVELQLLAKCKP